ncbi:hypothetical protein E2C01_093376 [Portunus trituberculatus]|uniref:Uncharacterized protein n=1 Tax=Portunus trituberculatus TaxID=210409 RepID=A0A5B7JUM1_PORTR|nr:hypothetical protein [Portunus trituberculatus]
MYASMPDTITDMSLWNGNSNHSRENQHNTSSGPPNWQKQNAIGTSALGNPEEGLEKQGKIQK